jgi:cytochrome c
MPKVTRMQIVRLCVLPVFLGVVLAASLVAQPANAEGVPANGEQLFRQRCGACHTVIADKPSKVGPNLSGVVGRKAASSTFAYSPALKASKLIWNRANLDKYLAAPTRMVPGSKMVVAVPDRAQRAALIQYLSLTR